MKNLSKRIISLIMIFAIILTIMPSNIIAKEVENKEGLRREEPKIIEPQINPEYEYYLEHPEEFKYGYIPPKYVLPFEKAPKARRQRRLDDDLPSKFTTDLSYVTSVKNQRRTGTCWAHSAISTIETLILSRGLAEYDSLDLSEGHMALNALKGYDLNSGGNNHVAFQYLSSLAGPVSEKNYPDYKISGNGIVKMPEKPANKSQA